MAKISAEVYQLAERELIKRGFSAAQLTSLSAFGWRGGSNSRQLDGPCCVYQLLDPWMAGSPPFYIGISNNPWNRFYAHCHDRCSAAYPLLRVFLKYGLTRDDILTIHTECATRDEAFDLEYRLVTSTPDLLNRPYKRGRAYT